MIKYIKTALCLASFACASTANAASFYQFDFFTSGIGSITSGYNTGTPLISSQLNNATISVRFDSSQIFYDLGDSEFGFGGSFFSVILSPNGVRFSDGTPSGRTADEVRTATACFNNYNVSVRPQIGYWYANTACSPVSIAVNDNIFSRTDYNGVVTSVAVSLRDGSANTFPITTIINGVPEPTTWALMLAGFAMTGYALRRRRANFAFA